jgi:glycosyltransferase involved in cell wall biosynthesis
MELASAMESLGWQCSLASDEDIAPGIGQSHGMRKLHHFAEGLRDFVKRNASAYDVVDYEHVYLPYPREEFCDRTLMVARSVLLVHHFGRTRLPHYRRLRSYVGLVVKGPRRYLEVNYTVRQADLTLRSCDLINLSNQDDRRELEARGIGGGKTVVIPYGLSRERAADFAGNRATVLPSEPRVAFVGTFGLRKGARELPEIVDRIVAEVPEAKVRLLGTRNRRESEILGFFPRRVHSNLEIQIEFSPGDLPGRLADCSLGIFPSYGEGFPFGMLEMLAAALPVVAYDAPGAPMMLSPEYLVKRGDAAELSRKVTQLLTQPERLRSARAWAKARSADFSWERSAHATSDLYTEMVERRRLEPAPRD